MKTDRHRISSLCLALAVLGLAGACGDDEAATPNPVAEPDVGDPQPDVVMMEPDASPEPDAGEQIEFCGETPEEIMDCVSAEGYNEAIEFIAKPRNHGSDHWLAVQNRCAEAFAEAGFEVERHDYGTGVNVTGTLRGVEKPDEYVVVSAHYDAVNNCSGADDNASGTAGVIEAARALGQQRYSRSLIVGCWDEEEHSKIGSQAWTALAAFRGYDVKASYIFEMIGYKRDAPDTQLIPDGFDLVFPDEVQAILDNDAKGDFILGVGDDINEEALDDIERFGEPLGLKVIKVRLNRFQRDNSLFGDLQRSDHHSFWIQDMPGIMITDTANFRNPHYHCERADDALMTLDLDFALSIVKATVASAAEHLGIKRGTPIPAPTPENPPSPDRPVCDLLVQQCRGGQKCTWTPGEDSGFERQCLDALGSQVSGEECTRPDGIPGLDTCAPGLFCAFFGLPVEDPQRRQCFAMCRNEDECGPSESCSAIGARGVGACTPNCSPLDEDTCPEETLCQRRLGAEQLSLSYTCDGLRGGATEEGGDCSMEPCQNGLACLTLPTLSATCYSTCDVTDDQCGPGLSCYPELREGAPEALGHCLPTLEE